MIATILSLLALSAHSGVVDSSLPGQPAGTEGIVFQCLQRCLPLENLIELEACQENCRRLAKP